MSQSGTSQKSRPTVRTISSVKEGFVEKKGPKAFCSFRTRYLILWSNKMLNYFVDASCEQLKGTVDLHLLHRRHIQRSKKSAKNRLYHTYGFTITTSNRVWYFSGMLPTISLVPSQNVHSLPHSNKWIGQ